MKSYESAGLTPNLDALRAEQRPGFCAVCDCPLRGRQTRFCGGAECRAAYRKVCQADWYLRVRRAAEMLKRARRLMERAAKKPSRIERKNRGR